MICALFLRRTVAKQFSPVNRSIAKQFSPVNRSIAENPQIVLAPDIINQVLEQSQILPTATLDWRVLCNNYKMEQIQAKNVVHLAQEYQRSTTHYPPSLLNMWTPHDVASTSAEQMLKARIMQLFEENKNYGDTVDTITAIIRQVSDEGLFEELICENIDRTILVDMNRKLDELYPEANPTTIHSLMWYHTLLFKTAGSNQWTLKRNPEEKGVEPYHPLLLEALKSGLEFRVVTTAEHLQNVFSGGALGGDDNVWTQVSILQFLHGLSQSNYMEPTSQATVPIVACQTQERCFKDASEGDEGQDEIFVNRKGEEFTIINGDLRKLYRLRPAGLESMTLAQFAVCYYKLKPHRKSIIDPQSDLGPESEESIVGGPLRVPLYVRLSNNIKMKKRTEGARPVPLMLKSDTLDPYGERLLFKCWRNFEELDDEVSEAELTQQTRIRLSLFPMSIFH